MASASTFEQRVYIAVNRIAKPEVLVLSDEDGWSLPTIKPLQGNYQYTLNLNPAVFETYGINATLLRTLSRTVSLEDKKEEFIFAMENHSLDWSPPCSGRWVGHADLDSLRFAIPSHKSVIATWINELEGKAGANRAPWELPGWVDTAIAWIESKLALLGLHQINSFRQFGVTPSHYLLEVSTAKGDFYFKSVRGTLAHEQALTCVMAILGPAYLPEIIAVDESQGYWLMRSVGGKRLSDVSDLNRWEEALRSFAQLQIDCIGHLDRLRAVGCPDWGLKTLTGGIDEFFTTTLPKLWAEGPQIPNDNNQIDHSSLAQRLKKLCEMLSDYDFPDSVGHGDFNFGNILVSDERIAFIDWAEGYIGHPLFTAFMAINYFGFTRPELKRERARWRAAYFEPWNFYFRPDQLMRAYCLARPLALLRGIMRASQYVLDSGRMQRDRYEGIAHILPQIDLMREAAFSPRIESG